MSDDYRIVIANEVVLRYDNALFEAKPRDEDKPDKLDFGATIILDNNKHGKLLDRVDEITERAALEEFKKKVPLKNRPVKDGNDKSDVEGFGDGTSYIAMYRKTRPAVVDRQLNPLTKEDGIIYPGCIVNVTFKVFAYDHPKGGKGVAVELIAVQFVRDGDRFSAGTSTDPKKYFKPIEGEDSYGSGSYSRSSGLPRRSNSRSGQSDLNDF